MGSQAGGITEKNYASGDLNLWVWAERVQDPGEFVYSEAKSSVRLSQSCSPGTRVTVGHMGLVD